MSTSGFHLLEEELDDDSEEDSEVDLDDLGDTVELLTRDSDSTICTFLTGCENLVREDSVVVGDTVYLTGACLVGDVSILPSRSCG